MKKLLTSGDLPYSVVILLVIAAFLWGEKLNQAGVVGGAQKHSAGVVIADKGAVILDAFMAHQDLTKDQLHAQIVTPIQQVLQHYRDQGFVVVNVSRDDDGHMTVDAVPADAKDVTDEMRKAVGLPPLPPAAKAVAPTPASAALATSGASNG